MNNNGKWVDAKTIPEIKGIEKLSFSLFNGNNSTNVVINIRNNKF